VATHTFQIIVTQSGAQATAAAIDQVGAAAQRSANALQFFRQALVVASTVRAATGLVDLIDAATRIDNRLKVATKSAEDFARAQQFVSQISRETRTDLEANAIIYSRLIRSTETLGYSSEYLEKVMRGLSLAVNVGGATSMEARNAMIQFTQALASGALRGDELRSVAEQLPALAAAIGKEFGVSGGQLLAFAKANPGILETERVVKAVAAAAPELQKEFDKTVPTLEQGFMRIKSAVIEVLGDINRGTGIFGVFSKTLMFVANNLSAVAIAAAAVVAIQFGSAIAAWMAPTASLIAGLFRIAGAMTSLTGIVKVFNLVMAINPLTLITTGIAAAVTAFVYLYQNVETVRKEVDLFFGMISSLVGVLGQMTSVIGEALPSWVTWEGTITAVSAALEVLVRGAGILIAAALVPVVRAVSGVILILNQMGAVSDETALKAVQVAAAMDNIVISMVQGTGATQSAGSAVEALTDNSNALLSPLLGVKTGTDALRIAQTSLAEEIKRVDMGYRTLGEGLLQAGSYMKSSEDGFNNLARVTKDWEKYTTDAGTATTSTTAATAAAKAPADLLAGSMKSVNTQASGAANASRAMATAILSSAESSTIAAGQVKEMSDLMSSLNPLLTAAKTAGEAAAAGFRAAGSAAQGAVAGVNALTEAFRRLAAAKAAAGQSGSSGSSGGLDGARAAGGPVLSGNTYLVGEKGPELFTPNTTGSIIPNHALQSNGVTAANDNTALVVKAINRMANAVVASNRMAARSNEQVVQEIVVQNQNTAKMLQRSAVALDQSTSFKGSGFETSAVLKTGPHYPSRFGIGIGTPYVYTSQGAFDQDEYSAFIRANKLLPGDSEYAANYKHSRHIFSSYDSNAPFAYKLDYMLTDLYASENEISGLMAKQKSAIEALKRYRDAGANFEQFKEALPEMAKAASKIKDFQTYTPMQGGPNYGANDPYGVGGAPRPSEKAQAAMAAKGGVGAQDNRVQVQMTINTPNAESFRQNRAQIESAVASMVDRANRRAGRR
jgi:tape measure domain-containing protein